jgi:hypothetical protein
LLSASEPVPTYKIHPAIGIARVGNSPTEFFFGPEKRWETPPLGTKSKDDDCRVKRQATRFRIFEYPDSGDPPFELVLDSADPAVSVTWSVSLRGNIGPRSGTISGFNQSPRLLTKTHPEHGDILLADLRTDAQGRLIFLGGLGWSVLKSIAGLDDTCDGSVAVSVTTSAGNLQVAPAWVVVAPPKYAPEHESIVTLYDLVEDRVQGSAPLTTVTSYTQHIYPILRRASRMGWLMEAAAPHHAWDLGDVASLPRNTIFEALKVPPGVTPPSGVSGGNMPPIGGLSLTPLQYARMRDFWSDTNFANDWTGEPVPATGEPTPSDLDRAALDGCVGGPLVAGIEVADEFTFASYFEVADPGRIRQTGPFPLEPGRLRQDLEPGWPGDYVACSQWPAVRPHEVNTGGGYEIWNRGAETRELLAANWARLGFVVRQPDGSFRESQRCPEVKRLGPLVRALDRVRRFVDVVDPPPPEVGRLRELVERVDDVITQGAQDELSDLASGMERMNEAELRTALMNARASRSRADAAVRLLESRLSRQRR